MTRAFAIGSRKDFSHVSNSGVRRKVLIRQCIRRDTSRSRRHRGLMPDLTPELRRTALRRRVGLITRTYHDAAKRCRLGRIVRRLTSELLLRGPRIPQEGSQTWASCTERVLCASELFTRVRDHRRSASAFKLHGVCGRLATRVAMTLGGRSPR